MDVDEKCLRNGLATNARFFYIKRGAADGRRREEIQTGGKSGHHRAGCWITSRRGNAKESATEIIPPAAM